MRPRIVHAVLAFLTLAVALACGGGDGTNVAVGGGNAEGLTPGIHSWTTNDGNTMPYEVGGAADATTTVLFIHCWMCERGFWDAQLPALAGAYRTITLDLPGHGRATANRSRWVVSAFGDDVAGLVRGLDLRNVVLVGHSMGGPIALRVAALTGGRVRGIVAVETLHDAEFEFASEANQAILRAFEMNYTNTCQQMVKQMFVEPNVASTIARVTTAGCGADKAEIGSALISDFATIDMKRWFREAGVPIRAINAGGGRPTELERNRTYADFDVALMDGVGHYPHMTRPDEFNALLLAAVRELAG